MSLRIDFVNNTQAGLGQCQKSSWPTFVWATSTVWTSSRLQFADCCLDAAAVKES